MLRKSLLLAFAIALPAAAQTPIRITADLTEVARKLYHAEIDIPVKSGPLTLTMPKWIPGTHAPNGPIADIMGLVFTANGKTVPFRRDEIDMFEFHVDVPSGVTSLHCSFDSSVTGRATNEIAVVEWERLDDVSRSHPRRQDRHPATVIVPKGWGIGTALTPVGVYDPKLKDRWFDRVRYH